MLLLPPPRNRGWEGLRVPALELYDPLLHPQTLLPLGSGEFLTL
jgi:hypothetical protein